VPRRDEVPVAASGRHVGDAHIEEKKEERPQDEKGPEGQSNGIPISADATPSRVVLRDPPFQAATNHEHANKPSGDACSNMQREAPEPRWRTLWIVLRRIER
jgi:hypothetical protein